MSWPNRKRSVDEVIAWLKKKTTITEDGHWRQIRPLLNSGHGKVFYHGRYISTSRFSAHVFLALDLEDSKSYALHKQSCPYKECWNPHCLYVGDAVENKRDRDVVLRRKNASLGSS